MKRAATDRRSKPKAGADLPLPKKKGRPRGTSTDTVYQSVRAQILNLTLEPGADLDENDLVKQFKISRTPVREALIRLSSEGLIRLLPNIGARVASLSANEVPQILESLELVQRATTRWAAVRRNTKDLEVIQAGCEAFAKAMKEQNYDLMTEANHLFHFAIAKAAKNEMLSGFHESLQAYALRLGRLAFSEAPISDVEYRAYYNEVDRQHRQMLKAIEEKTPEVADEIVKKHIALFRKRIVRHLSDSLAADMTIKED